MKSFEITVKPGSMVLTLRVKAQDWLEAAREALVTLASEFDFDLEKLGSGGEADGIRVTDLATGLVHAARSLEELASLEAAAPAREAEGAGDDWRDEKALEEPSAAERPKAELAETQPLVSALPDTQSETRRRGARAEKNPDLVQTQVDRKPLTDELVEAFVKGTSVPQLETKPTRPKRPVVRSPALKKKQRVRKVRSAQRVDCDARYLRAMQPMGLGPPKDMPDLLNRGVATVFDYIKCHGARCLMPAEEADGYWVVAARGDLSDDVLECYLELPPELRGLPQQEATSLHFSGDGVDLLFTPRDPEEPQFLEGVRSVLWAPVNTKIGLLAVLLLVDSLHASGFSRGHISGARYLTATLVKQFERYFT